MADAKISALTSLAGTSVDAAADVLAIVDTSVTTTKKVTVDELAIAALASTVVGRFKVGSFSRTMSVATGNVAYTGVGFKPKAVIFLATVSNGSLSINSTGFSDAVTGFSTVAYTTTTDNAGFGSGGANCIYVFDDAALADINTATIASMDSDGFTLSWVKAGTPTTAASVYYLAFR